MRLPAVLPDCLPRLSGDALLPKPLPHILPSWCPALGSCYFLLVRHFWQAILMSSRRLKGLHTLLLVPPDLADLQWST